MMSRVAVLLMAAALWVSCVGRVQTADEPSRAARAPLPAAPAEVRLAPYFRELRTVEATSGEDTLRLLLDTGGGHTLLTPEAAQRIGCRPFGRNVGHRMSGERVEFQRCSGDSLRLAGQTLGSGSVAVFDLGTVLPPELPKLDGLLALPSFVDLVVTFDMAGDRLILESQESAALRRAEQSTMRPRIASGDDGSSLTILVAAEADPAPVWLWLDNANLVGTLLSPSGARQLGRGEMDLQGGTPLELEMRLLGLPSRSTRASVRDIIFDGRDPCARASAAGRCHATLQDFLPGGSGAAGRVRVGVHVDWCTGSGSGHGARGREGMRVAGALWRLPETCPLTCAHCPNPFP
jgi:hypothetical protein